MIVRDAYDSRLYQEILDELKGYAKQKWPTWNVDAKTIGNILLECVSDQMEKVEYRMDLIVNELFPETAIDYRSVLRWARMIGYPVQSVLPAKASVLFTLPDEPLAPITIPAGTIIHTSGSTPIMFETITDAVFRACQTKASVIVRQVESKKDSFIGTGETFQVYQSNWGSVWDESIEVYVNDQRWTMVSDFVLSEPQDQHYTYELQKDGTILIFFGNGERGKCPGLHAEIDLVYQVSKGKAGESAINTITQVASVVYDDRGYLIDVGVSNYEPAAGAQNQETLNQIRENIPRWISTSRTAVSKLDFENATHSVVGVERALAHGHDQDINVPALDVWIYVVPIGGGVANQVLLDEVYNELTVKRSKMNSLQIKVKPANYKVLNIKCGVKVGYSYRDDEIKEKVESAIRDFFDYKREDPDGTFSIEWGKPIYVSQLISFIMSKVAGVANLDFGELEDTYPAFNEIIGLGTVSVHVT